MRYVITTLFTLVTCVVLSAQAFIDNRTDLQKLEMKGRVKRVNVYDIQKAVYLTQEEIQELQRQGLEPPYYRRSWERTLDFNVKGFITKSRDPESWDCYDNTYAPDGKLMAVTSYNEEGGVKYVYSFEYNKLGFITAATRQSQDKVFFKENYTCNESGMLVSMTHDYLDGRIQKENFVYVDGKISKWVRTLNDEPTQTFVFDGDIARLTESYYWRHGACTHIRINYNDKQQPATVSTETTAGKWYVSTRRTFDDHGNVIEEKTYAEDGRITGTKTITYTYDVQGNWTIRVVKSNEKDDDVVQEREIEYY